MKVIYYSIALSIALLMAAQSYAEDRFITIASATSPENSGFYAAVLPKFTEITGIDVRVIAVGTGKAIKIARNGDADMLFGHHKPSEEQFVRDGFGVQRINVMYNDFVIVGPKTDPAKVRATKDVVQALEAIVGESVIFVSRGDESGTHEKERALWRDVGLDPTTAESDWYREAGLGMGATLNMASVMDAYTLSDRASWLNFKNKGDLELLVEGDQRLFNQYSIILVSAEKHPHVNIESGQKFIDWLLSESGRTTINSYKAGGQQAFFASTTGY